MRVTWPQRLRVGERSREALIFVYRTGVSRTEVLLVHRCRELGGYWHAVAGGVEEGETDEEAALRELREETGLDGSRGLCRLRHSFSYVLPDEPGEEYSSRASERIVVTCFRVDAPHDWEPQLDWEHDEYRWCDEREAARLLYWPRVRRALVALVGVAPQATA